MKRIVRRRGAEESASRQRCTLRHMQRFSTPFSSVNTDALFPNKIIFQCRPSSPSWRTAGVCFRWFLLYGTVTWVVQRCECSSLPLRTRNGFGAAPAQNDQNINTRTRTHSQAHTTHPPPAGTIP